VKARLWRDNIGSLDRVEAQGPDKVVVIRDAGYSRPGSIACELQDTGNGYIARFPPHSSLDQDAYVCLDYDQARSLILALSPYAKELGFQEQPK
jgi:hypothetical protein